MKFQINRPIKGSPKVAEYNVAIMRALEKLTVLVPGLDQWRFIIEEWEGDKLIWLFDVSPKASKGDKCALQKIATLAHFPAIDNTGELRNPELSNPDNLKDLLDRTGQQLVHWYGGVRLRLTDFMPLASDTDEIETSSTEIRAAFSGAREDADAFFAIAALLAVNKTWAKNHPEMYTHYNFGPLETDPVTGLALNILRQME